jgi:hypothetical protein
MNKEQLKDHLLSLEYAEINEVERNYEDFIKDSDLDRDDTIDSDDQSQHAGSAELSDGYEQQLTEHEHHIELLNSIDFSPTDTVKVGSVLETPNRYIFIGLPFREIDYKGKPMIGISVNAPFYKSVANKQAGAECSFNHKKFTIVNVY